MANSARILSDASGNLTSEIMFVGEAPGRLGADQTAIPFHGDTTGNNFERLLQDAGLDRNSIFVTNAVLCNPKDAHGNNATPSQAEMTNCSQFLKRQIDIVDPRLVVTLGQTALTAVGQVSPHSLVLAQNVATVTPWYERFLMPLYHPGPRAIIHRPARFICQGAALRDASERLSENNLVSYAAAHLIFRPS
jgi:uracil-DNA glycosylase family 4